jgi:hypothetical protein
MDPVKTLEKYLPVAVSEVSLYGEGGLLRFSGLVTKISADFGDYYAWYFEDKGRIVCYLETSMLDRNDVLIQELFSKDFPKLFETIKFLKSTGWRGSAVTIYGQTIFIDEDTDWVHFQAHYFLPQTFQAEVDKKRIKSTEKLIINKITEEQAKDFAQRKEQLAKLFKGISNE